MHKNGTALTHRPAPACMLRSSEPMQMPSIGLERDYCPHFLVVLLLLLAVLFEGEMGATSTDRSFKSKQNC
jgi:hypothetical protein